MSGDATGGAAGQESTEQYARELEDLVIELYALVKAEIDLCDRGGWLRRQLHLRGIPGRMAALGFVGDVEEDAPW